MADTSELTETGLEKAHQFARYLLLHVGPLIDQMQLALNQAELAFGRLRLDTADNLDESLVRVPDA